jgi:hypothetical protein
MGPNDRLKWPAEVSVGRLLALLVDIDSLSRSRKRRQDSSTIFWGGRKIGPIRIFARRHGRDFGVWKMSGATLARAVARPT